MSGLQNDDSQGAGVAAGAHTLGAPRGDTTVLGSVHGDTAVVSR